jgi:hypothetical protein
VYAQQAVTVGAADIGGTVVGASGPEAGVWVIAETTELPTKFARIVVTDDSGRYLIPDLPTANYSVWVRGYGLVDSPKLVAKPGQLLNHTAIPAPNDASAARYYPAIYWYAMMKIPPAGDFGGKSDIPAKLTQTDWLKMMKNLGCIGCHQLGQEATRTIPETFGKFDTGAAAWMRRVQSGQSGEQMTNYLAGIFGGAPFKYLGDWTDRVARGELPKDKPPRPQSWEWSTPDKYLHDLISSDRRHPTVNSYGPLYGSPEYSTDNMPILDPETNTVSFFKTPVADPEMPESLGPGHAASARPLEPSAYWGDRKLWDTRANNHNSMFDEKGRLWLSATVRGLDNPAFCKQGSDHPSAKVVPLEKSARQVAMLDPKTMKYSFISTCFGTHHLQFGYDANDTLWLGCRLDQHQGVRRNRRCGKVARLVAVRARHQRQRQARRLCRAQRPARSEQGQADRPGFGTLRGDAVPGRRLDLVHGGHLRRYAGGPAIRPGDRTVGSVQRPRTGVWNPRRRYRQEWRGLGIVIEWPPRQL